MLDNSNPLKIEKLQKSQIHQRMGLQFLSPRHLKWISLRSRHAHSDLTSIQKTLFQQQLQQNKWTVRFEASMNHHKPNQTEC